MTDDLTETYPEAAPYIREAVEDWVVENYHPKFAQLGVVMDIPAIEELPFYDAEQHDVPTEAERTEMARAYGEYLDNLRRGHKPGEE